MPTLSQNIFQSFRSPGSIFTGDSIAGGKLSKTFDEPTYLTFRVSFRSANTNLELTNYDRMPHPLFEMYKEDDINARNFYSTRQFLRDANEFVREQMLIDFISKWNDLQNNYQWYFQNITGIDSLLKVDAKRGSRVPKDGKVTIRMLEGLDLKVTHLLNLYRKIAWDDVYQRWILPDMMRYFMMDIYITEFRIFHQSNLKVNTQTNTQSGVFPPKKTFLQGIGQRAGFGVNNTFQSSEVPEMILSIMDDLMPTYVLHCERCEIDLASLSSQFSDLNVSEPTMAEVSFDVNVGNLTEEYRNTLLDSYYTDRIINGLERTQEFQTQWGEVPLQIGFGNPTSIMVPQDVPYTPTKLSGNTNANPFIHPDEDYGSKASHTSGKPFLESGGSGQSNLDNASKASTQGPTWVGNIVKFGKAFTENLLDSAIDKLKVSRIPGLNVSFSEALAAIQSKNVFTVFGLVRQSMTLSLNGTLSPSQATNGEVAIDNQFKNFLQQIAGLDLSKATDDQVKLAKAANQVLNDKGIWEQIKDMSLATDLLSKAMGEINMGKPLENPTALKQNAEILTNKDRSLATDLDGIPRLVGGPLVYKGIVSSTSTSGSIEEKGITRTKLGSTDGAVQKGDFVGTDSTIDGTVPKPEFAGTKPNTGISDGGLITSIPGAATLNEGLPKPEFSGSKSNTGINEGGVTRVAPGVATSKDGIEKPDFSGSKPNIGIQDGGLNSVAPSLATSKKDIEKGSFGGSAPKTEIQEGGLITSDPGQATKGEIENAKYLFGNVAKKQGIVQKPMDRPEPGEAVDDDTKLNPIPRPEKGDINKTI